MSNIADMGLDLENLFQPAWAQGKSEGNRFEKFTGEEGGRSERRREPKSGGDFGGRGERGPGRENRDRRQGQGERARAGGRSGERRGGPPRNERHDRSDRGPGGRDRVEPAVALPELNVAFIPEERGVEQLARQIRMTGRAYPLFQIAQLILEKGERYSVQLTSKKKGDATATQKIYVCALDDTAWAGEEEAIAHVLKHHFATFYQTDRTPCDPPKGVYTFVAQCGMSGTILGPPNYHDYRNQLRKLHAERFSRMPFDAFKSRVKIVKDEAVVKKWIDDQSSRIEYTALNVPEPVKLPSLEEVEKHFRATHKDSIIKPVETHTIGGAASRTLRSTGLQQLIRKEWEHQRHFPLPVATKLSQQLAGHGLQFFKVNKTFTHVSVARPQYLDIESSPVSDGIKRIVEYINANPKCTRKKLIQSLAPGPTPEAVTGAAAPANDNNAAPPVSATAQASPVEAKPTEPTPEQTAVMMDLHWLIHQGAVLEFADGRMETAKKPLPKPPKPERKEEKIGAKAVAPSEENAPGAATENSGADGSAQGEGPVPSDEPVPAPSLEAIPREDESAPANRPPESGQSADSAPAA